MNVVLDTHAWVFLASEPARLGRRAASAIRLARVLFVPAICMVEVARLAANGRIDIGSPLGWLEDALALPKVELVALSPRVAVEAQQLGADFHDDPADRLIVATAIVEAVPIVTKDARIRDYDRVRSIW